MIISLSPAAGNSWSAGAAPDRRLRAHAQEVREGAARPEEEMINGVTEPGGLRRGGMSASDLRPLSAGDINCRRRKPVADSRVALQELAVLVVELAADSVGVDLQVVQFPVVTGTPDVLQDHPAGADLSGVAGTAGTQVTPSLRSIPRTS